MRLYIYIYIYIYRHSAEWRARLVTFMLLYIYNSVQTECPLTNDSAVGDQAKTWIQQHVPMMSEQWAQLTSLPINFGTWSWWYICMYVCMYVRIMYVCMYVCMHVCMYVYMYYVCMYVCMHACMHVCMYVSPGSGTGMELPNRKETNCLPQMKAGFVAGKLYVPDCC